MTKVLEALEKISNTKCYEKESSCWDTIGYLCSDEIVELKLKGSYDIRELKSLAYHAEKFRKECLGGKYD